jgi:hypothetical protein
VHRAAENNKNGWVLLEQQQGVSVVSDNAVVVMMVKLDGEDAVRNISETHQLLKRWESLKTRSKGKNIIRVYLKENILETYKFNVCILGKHLLELACH